MEQRGRRQNYIILPPTPIHFLTVPHLPLTLCNPASFQGPFTVLSPHNPHLGEAVMRGPPPPSTEWNDAEGSRIIEDGRPPLSPAPGPAPAAAFVAALPVAPEGAVEDGGAFAPPPPAPPLPPAPAAAAPAPAFPPAPCDRFSSTAFFIFCFRARSCPLSEGGQQAGGKGRDDMEGKGQQAQGRGGGEWHGRRGEG